MRSMWIVVFWVWAIVGLLINGFHVFLAHSMYELGVGTSAAVMMDIVFWVGGSLVFGLGAILTKEDIAPAARVDPMYQGQQAVSDAILAEPLPLLSFVCALCHTPKSDPDNACGRCGSIHTQEA